MARIINFILLSLFFSCPFAFLLHTVANDDFGNKKKWAAVVCAMVSYTLAQEFGLMIPFPFDILFAIFIYFACFKFIYKKNILISFCYSILLFAILFLIEPVVYYALLYIDEDIFTKFMILGNREITSNTVVIMSSAMGFLFVIAAVVLRRLIKVFESLSLIRSIIFRIIAGSVLTIVYMTVSIYSILQNIGNINAMAYISLGMGIVTLFGYQFISTNIHLYRSVVENNTMNQQVSLTMELLNNLKMFKHNYLNIIYGFGGHLLSGDTESLMDYYNETVAISRTINNDNVHSLYKIKNLALFNFIKEHVTLCKEQGILFNINIDNDIIKTALKDPDLCQILGIYLDNAREAAIQAEEPLIRMDILSGENMVEFYIYNSFSKDYEAGKARIDNRGNGLSYAKQIIGKYKNIVDNTYESNGMYTQQLIVMKKEAGFFSREFVNEIEGV